MTQSGSAPQGDRSRGGTSGNGRVVFWNPVTGIKLDILAPCGNVPLSVDNKDFVPSWLYTTILYCYAREDSTLLNSSGAEQQLDGLEIVKHLYMGNDHHDHELRTLVYMVLQICTERPRKLRCNFTQQKKKNTRRQYEILFPGPISLGLDTCQWALEPLWRRSALLAVEPAKCMFVGQLWAVELCQSP